MTQKNKQLLLADLCARLPYGVILNVTLKDKYDEIVNRDIELTDGNLTYITRDSHWIMYKPYLRPMSSMTEEEEKEICQFMKDYNLLTGPNRAGVFCGEIVDWLNAHHFDYRGLIEKRLAITTEEFNPYKE